MIRHAIWGLGVALSVLALDLVSGYFLPRTPRSDVHVAILCGMWYFAGRLAGDEHVWP